MLFLCQRVGVFAVFALFSLRVDGVLPFCCILFVNAQWYDQSNLLRSWQGVGQRKNFSSQAASMRAKPGGTWIEGLREMMPRQSS